MAGSYAAPAESHKASRINQIYWIIYYIGICVDAAIEPDRVGLNIPSECRVVVPVPVVA